MDLRHRLFEVLEPRLAQDLVDLVDVEVEVRRRRRTIRLLVDRLPSSAASDGPRMAVEGDAETDPNDLDGVTINDCARISRRVEDILDAEDLIPFQYVLEVSSPGADRPLSKPAHFTRFVGERVTVRMDDAFGPRRQFSGVLLGLRDDQAWVRLSEDEEVLLPLGLIHQARVHIDPWEKAKRRGR
jgi:ribosome maturation factor RimP